MSATAIVINAVALAALIWCALRDRWRTGRALVAALRSLLALLPMVLSIIVLIGLLLAFVTPESIRHAIGAERGLAGILTATGVGALMHIPALISFPLSASLVQGGASIGAAAAFITSLTMIGAVTLPLELRELGMKIALLRNGLGLLAAVLIALLIEAAL